MNDYFLLHNIPLLTIVESTPSAMRDATFLYKDEAIKKASCDLNIVCYSLALLPNNILIALSHHEKKFIKFSLSVTNKVKMKISQYEG